MFPYIKPVSCKQIDQKPNKFHNKKKYIFDNHLSEHKAYKKRAIEQSPGDQESVFASPHSDMDPVMQPQELPFPAIGGKKTTFFYQFIPRNPRNRALDFTHSNQMGENLLFTFEVLGWLDPEKVSEGSGNDPGSEVAWPSKASH